MFSDLKSVENSPGVWRLGPNERQSGTFAFITGISNYEYLDGSEDVLGLTPLHVSALTAFRFFKYLVDSYTFEDGPFFEATVLLAPTAEEIDVIGSLGGSEILQSTPVPTLAEMTKQLRRFRDRIERLDEEQQRCSRVFVFFSGHGLEMDVDSQILLPYDYPGAERNYDDAISTRNVYQGLGDLDIPVQFHFIDTCRNNPSQLYRLQKLSGARVFNNWRGGMKGDAPVMYASSPGGFAWQPTSAKNASDISFFGKALLDGLTAQDHSLALDRSQSPVEIRLFPLFDCVEKAVVRKLAAIGVASSRSVSMGGVVTNRVVAHLGSGRASPENFSGSDTLVGGISDPRRDQSDISGDGLEDTVKQVPWNVGVEFISGANFESVDSALGNKLFASFVRLCEIYAWSDDIKGWTPSNEIFDILRIETRGKFDARLHFRFKGNVTWRWIQYHPEPERNELTWGFMLPPSEDPVFLLRFAQASAGDSLSVDISMDLSELNTSAPLRNAAKIWNAYVSSSSPGAIAEIHRLAEGDGKTYELAVRLLDDKYESPLAATVAALILMRTSAGDFLEWYENLALNVSPYSDAAIFCLQRSILTGGYSIEEMRPYLNKIIERGLPATSEACFYLFNFLNDATLDNQSLKEPSSLKRLLGLDGKAYSQANFSFEAFRETGKFLRNTSLFTSVCSHPAAPRPNWLR